MLEEKTEIPEEFENLYNFKGMKLEQFGITNARED